MLDRSEAVTKLILDERWEGASAARRREAEALEREAELARQRLEQERLAKEEEEQRQAEREKVLTKKKGIGRGAPRTAGSSSSGVRGVRGTRASMRARGHATGNVRGRIYPFFNATVVLIVAPRYNPHLHLRSWEN